MKVLTLNSGSSSLKYKLFRAEGLVPLASGTAERIGEEDNRLLTVWCDAAGEKKARERQGCAPDHATALQQAFADLSGQGVLRDCSELLGIGHRVVHGGERFTAPTRVTAAVHAEIRALEHLAPLHNPPNLLGIDVARRLCPDVPQVAVFDTAFHATLPDHAARYALPQELYEQFHVRRYGFHGTSVQYVTRRAAELMGRDVGDLNLIVLHLGNGASATAVAGGRSIDTSMGMTPLEGLVMGTRSGDLDPAAHFHLLRHGRFSVDSLEHLLFHGSGLKGLCGVNDMRAVHARAEQGDPRALLTLQLFCYRLKKYIGSYLAVLGRVDAVVFTAGIGEHDPEVRARSLAGLEHFGIQLDAVRNNAAAVEARPIHSASSRVQLWVIPTDEEQEIARSVIEVLRAQGAKA